MHCLCWVIYCPLIPSTKSINTNHTCLILANRKSCNIKGYVIFLLDLKISYENTRLKFFKRLVYVMVSSIYCVSTLWFSESLSHLVFFITNNNMCHQFFFVQFKVHAWHLWVLCTHSLPHPNRVRPSSQMLLKKNRKIQKSENLRLLAGLWKSFTNV